MLPEPPTSRFRAFYFEGATRRSVHLRYLSRILSARAARDLFVFYYTQVLKMHQNDFLAVIVPLIIDCNSALQKDFC